MFRADALVRCNLICNMSLDASNSCTPFDSFFGVMLGIGNLWFLDLQLERTILFSKVGFWFLEALLVFC